MKTKLLSHNTLRCALPLAAAFLLPSVALAATNLPPPDAGQIGETAQQNALKSHLPVTEGGAESATFRLARITVTQDGTQLSADELNRRAAGYAERTISEAELNALLGDLTQYARSHGYPAAVECGRHARDPHSRRTLWQYQHREQCRRG